MWRGQKSKTGRFFEPDQKCNVAVGFLMYDKPNSIIMSYIYVYIYICVHGTIFY